MAIASCPRCHVTYFTGTTHACTGPRWPRHDSGAVN